MSEPQDTTREALARGTAMLHTAIQAQQALAHAMAQTREAAQAFTVAWTARRRERDDDGPPLSACPPECPGQQRRVEEGETR
jgi:hypothetical protein